MQEGLIIKYFNWLCQLAIADPQKRSQYSDLLSYLFYREFVWAIPNDAYRAEYGMLLRETYAGDARRLALLGPSSVLEVMVALADQCEERIMQDSSYGDRTSEWFWAMIESMGLDHMYNSGYDVDVVEDIVTRMLIRDYAPDGRGGMFTVQHPREDMRYVELWYQMNWYANEISEKWEDDI